MNCVFFGTPEFSRRVLELIINRHKVSLVVTQPDRPAGRGRKLISPPVLDFCRSEGIECLQPQSPKDPGLIDKIRNTGAEAGILVSYGSYIPGTLLDSLPHGFINLHPSLLPKYRGAAPVNWALIRGEKKTGVTIMKMTGEMDAGPILKQKEIVIRPDETAGELLMRLAKPGAELMLEALDEMSAGSLLMVPQDESRATYAPTLKKEDGSIDWTLTAGEIVNLVRGVNPWPGAHTYNGRMRVKVWYASEAGREGGTPGEILVADPRSGLLVAAGRGSVSLEILQKEGGKPLPFGTFLPGARWKVGDILSAG